MKILVIRFSSIGDIVLTSPIVRCLKKKFPNSEIHFLTKDKFIELVKNNMYVDEIKSISSDNEKQLLESLVTEDYSIVVDLHKNLRTRKLKKTLSKASWYSYKKLNVKKWLLVNFKLNLMPDKHIIDRYFDGLNELGVKNDNEGVDYFFSPGFKLNLEDYKLAKNEYTVIAIGGTYFTKQIPLKQILSLFKRLNGDIVLIGGGDSDANKAQELLSLTDNTNVLNLCNKLSIEQSAALIKNAKTIITGDTGMMHIASAFDTAINTIWGNTSRQFGMYAYRPNKELIFNHSVSLKCNPCSKLGSNSCPRGHFKCMNMQNVEQIVKNC
jgi:ADP-heptose:LPS heptosyltransferase